MWELCLSRMLRQMHIQGCGLFLFIILFQCHCARRDTYLTGGSGRVVLSCLHWHCRTRGDVQRRPILAGLPQRWGCQLLGLAGVDCRAGPEMG